jgi:peptide deformylase
MMARVVQHELDHLNGVLFIDRLSQAKQVELRSALDEFETDFSSKRGTGGIPTDAEITARLAELEGRYC